MKKIDNIIINSNCRYCYKHDRKLNYHLRMWMYDSEIYWQINLISTDESQFTKMWFNKKSRFNTECPTLKIVHKLFDFKRKKIEAQVFDLEKKNSPIWGKIHNFLEADNFFKVFKKYVNIFLFKRYENVYRENNKKHKI